MSDLLTEQDVRDRLQQACDLAGGQARFAQARDIRESLISDTLNAKRAPGPKVLSALGLQKVTRFANTRRTNAA